MKALSVDPLLAWAIAVGYKPIENRSWTTEYRGYVYIHATAAKTVAGDLFEELGIDEEYHAYCEAVEASGHPDLPWGGIVGAARLWKIVPAESVRLTKSQKVWAMPKGYWWFFKEPVLFPRFIPCKGQLGLWQLDERLKRLVMEATREAAKG
jgi:hypothetical protein